MGRSKLKAGKGRGGHAPRVALQTLPARVRPHCHDENDVEDESTDILSGEEDLENDEECNVTDREKDVATRIRDLISEVFSLERKSSYCHNQTYHVSDIPNPLLRIDGFDFLGVPVNGSTARDIAPFFQPHSSEKNSSQTTRFLAFQKVTLQDVR
ncbi:hypothetical protein PM082_006902 [Marasmius tenuissimus]|nr:hypothetical protein PM082_006902 [Marasmius tenuissimus]